MGNIIGFDPDFDYLLDPQARDRKLFEECCACGSAICRGDSFIRFCAGRTVVTLCDRCALTMESCIAGEEESA